MINKIFIAHPHSVDETYFQHARFASGFAIKLLVAGFCATVHAIIPCLFEKTASRMIAEMYTRTHGRGQ